MVEIDMVGRWCNPHFGFLACGIKIVYQSRGDQEKPLKVLILPILFPAKILNKKQIYILREMTEMNATFKDVKELVEIPFSSPHNIPTGTPVEISQMS